MSGVLESIIKDIIYNKRPFGTDIDGVLLNFEPFFRTNINEIFDVSLNEGDIVIYEASKLIPLKNKGVTQKEIYEAVRKMGNKHDFTRIKTKQGVHESLKLMTGGDYLSNGYENFFINTSRSNRLYDDVEDKTHETLRYNEVLFYDQNVIFDPEKEYVAKALGLRLFFEDDIITALKIMRKKIPVVMITESWNKKTPRDIVLLDREDAKYKHALVDELRHYNDKVFFRFDNFIEFNKYLKAILN